ncbi:MAG: MFS transporter [Pseudomonadota bacterium]|nr:MFS transporter [Pseudomonadota bacterium]
MLPFLVLLFAYVLSQFYRAFLAIVAGDLSRDVGLDAADLGALSAIWFATFALAQFPVGMALDRAGPRRTIAGFMVLAVAGAAWLSLARSFPECLAAMALIGVGCSPVLMGSLYYFGRVYPAGRFAMLSSLMIGLGSAGNLLGATPLAVAVEALGWRGAMGAIAGITAVSALVVILLLRDPPRVETQGGGATVLGGLGEIAGIRALWVLLPLTFTSYAVVIAARSLWIAPFFGEVHGFSVTERGNAALVMAAAMTLGALAYGPIERWLGSPKTTTLAGSLVTAASFVALGLAGERSAALGLALLAAAGAAGMTYGILMAHARLFFPVRLLGRGVTFMNFAFIGGAGIVQWLSGRFVQAARDAGTAPDAAFGQLHLAFGIVLLTATAVYALAPARPEHAARVT